jgi:hypothetical protein
VRQSAQPLENLLRMRQFAAFGDCDLVAGHQVSPILRAALHGQVTDMLLRRAAQMLMRLQDRMVAQERRLAARSGDDHIGDGRIGDTQLVTKALKLN